MEGRLLPKSVRSTGSVPGLALAYVSWTDERRQNELRLNLFHHSQKYGVLGLD